MYKNGGLFWKTNQPFRFEPVDKTNDQLYYYETEKLIVVRMNWCFSVRRGGKLLNWHTCRHIRLETTRCTSTSASVLKSCANRLRLACWSHFSSTNMDSSLGLDRHCLAMLAAASEATSAQPIRPRRRTLSVAEVDMTTRGGEWMSQRTA